MHCAGFLQATCNKADMTDCTHCPARLDLLDNSLYTQQAPFLSAEATNPPLRSNLLHANLQCSQPPSSAVILQASSVLNSAANVICQRSRDFKRHIFRTKQQQLVASPCYDISVAPPQLQPEQLQTLLPCQLQEGQQGQQQVEDAQQDRQTLQALQAQHAQQAQQAQTPPQQQPQQHSHSLPYVRQPQAEAVSTRSLPETISYGELLETDLPKVAQAVVSQSPQDGLASQPAQQLHQLRHQEPLEQVHNTQGQHRHQQDQASVSGSAAKHGTPQDHLKVRTKWGHVAPSTPNSYQQSQVKVRRAASDELHSHSSTPPEHVKDGYIKEQGGKQETQGQKQQQQQHHDPMAAPVRVGRRRSTSDETPIAPKTPTH